MFALKHRLNIGGKIYPAVKRVKIDTSRSTKSDIAIIELPKYRNLKRADLEEAPVKFEAGYKQYGLFTEFEGFVMEISEKQPYTLTCEDYFHVLKGTISKTFKDINSGDIIKQLCSGTDIDTGKVQNGAKIKYKVYNNKSMRFILSDLAKRSGFDCFMRGKTLIFDKPFKEADEGDIGIFRYGLNMIEDNLAATEGEYDKVIVISESTNSDGEIYKGTAGSGKKIKKVYIDNLGKEDVTKRAEEMLSYYIYKGFRGDILSFGYPPVFHSKKIHIIDDRFPDKSGYYHADRAEKEYGDNGFRQRIYIYW